MTTRRVTWLDITGKTLNMKDRKWRLQTNYHKFKIKFYRHAVRERERESDTFNGGENAGAM